ncbi:MAG: response regulator [candidate division WOR-3 bacterium]
MRENKRPLILLVEDEPDVALVTSTRLELNGFAVKVVADGLSAFTTAVEIHPSLVLIDLKIPGLSGQELVKRMRADSRLSSIPIIIFTASSSGEGDLKRLCCDLGANEYVHKPYSPDELIRKVRTLVRQTVSADVSG